jgi:hypothetical protein
MSSGDYLSARLPVPSRPESGTAFNFLIEAEDAEGAVARKSIDVEIVDDRDAPVVEMSQPSGEVELMPGDTVPVSGTVVDNNSTDKLEVVVSDGNGNEETLPWDELIRSDKTETITVPNPGSFGEAATGQRTVTSFDGRIRLPLSWLDRAGERYELFVGGPGGFGGRGKARGAYP